MIEHTNGFPSKLILWGGTGQAKVVTSIVENFGSRYGCVQLRLDCRTIGKLQRIQGIIFN
jgi:hypothetical protein